MASAMRKQAVATQGAPAKTSFRAATHAVEVVRGDSQRALYVTAIGVPVEPMAALVRRMTGAHRIPDALRRVEGAFSITVLAGDVVYAARDSHGFRPLALGKLDAGTLKLKVAASIVAISSIHLLRVFMNAQQTDNDKILWYVILHLTFVVSAVLLGVLDRLAFATHREE